MSGRAEEDRSGALPLKPRVLPVPVDEVPWRPLDGVPDGWRVAHRGAGRFLLRDPEGEIRNHLDDLWTLAMCRFVAEVDRMPQEETISPRVQATLLGLNRGWSHERLREEAADVLGLEGPAALEELPDDDLVRLVAEWEPVNLGSRR